ncbi:MAG: hypothetical protein NT029_21880 [Armatimonadetes bacterium]|nr:hypothetical protein [Armatimonadota bacterium]
MITSRPAGAAAALAGLFLLTAAGMVWIARSGASAPSDAGGFLWFAAALGAGALAAASWGVACFVRADAAGLRWRSFRGSGEAGWADVVDYYEEALPRSGKLSVIITRSGRVALGPESSRLAELKAAVRERAASTASTEWSDGTGRLADGEEALFAYSPAMRRIGLAALAASTALATGVVVPRAAPLTAEMGLGYALGALGTFVLMAVGTGAMPLLMACSMGGGAGRRGESVTATRRGIAFRSAAGSVEAEWADVTAFAMEPMRTGFLTGHRYRAVTRHGDFTFDPAIAGVHRLKRIIVALATDAATKEWAWLRGAEPDDLGPPAASHSMAAGAQVFHYRTRSVRALLLLQLAIAVCGAAAGAARRYVGSDDPSAQFGLAGVMLAGWAWGLWRQRAALVTVDETGVTKHGLGGASRIEWRDVRGYRVVGDDLLTSVEVRSSDGRRLRIWIGISRVEDLKAQIARRAPATAERGWG